MTLATLDLPDNGVITREIFEALPTPGHGWAWELHDGRLQLVHTPVSHWHWKIILMILDHWAETGLEVSGGQYVADNGFARDGTGRNNYVAHGVVFVAGHKPRPRDTTHAADVIHAVVEAVSDTSEERDATDKLAVYARQGIAHYWVVRGDSDADEIDGMITIYELRDGAFVTTGHKVASLLTEA